MIKRLLKPEVILLCLLFAVAAFFRLYRIDAYMTFLGDEGRDALVIQDLLVNHHLPFIGPPTSVGNMYLGPLYYYMMAVPMAIFWLNPVAAAVMDAIIGLLAIGLIYLLGKRWFGMIPAFVVATLYAISPVTIYYSRSSWNPNPAPFFSLLGFYSLDQAFRTRDFKWIILTGFSLAAAVQMHYLALILLPIDAVLWGYLILSARIQRTKIKHLILGTIGGVLAFLIVMTPLVLFDLKHNFMNYRAFMAFFGDRQTTVNLNIFNSIGRILPIYNQDLISHYLTGYQMTVALIVSLLTVVPIGILIWLYKKDKLPSWPHLLVVIWLLGGLAGLSLYKQTIYDHYLGFLSPAPYLLLAAVIGFFKKNWQIIPGLLILLPLAFLNLQKNPLLLPPNEQVWKTQQIAKYIIARSDNKPFNFALLSKNNYDAAYQFYLDTYGYPPKKVPDTITDQLFVVCEDPVCEPVNNPKYEIAAWGWAKIDNTAEFKGVKIYKLVHNKGNG